MRFVYLAFAFLLFLISGSSVMAKQVVRSHPGCTGGGKEAQELFNLGRDYSYGINGMPYDRDRAVKLYRESFELGNPKAGINLGLFLRMAYAEEPGERERLDLMLGYFQKAIDMGCPDAYHHLAECYDNGWGVARSEATARRLIKKGAEAGSFACMMAVGAILDSDGKPEEAKVWLQRALDGGFGPAADILELIYFAEGNLEKEIQVLRQGARMGNRSSLISLSNIYKDGDRQPKDQEYADCFRKLAKSINTKLPPPMIDNLDELCPPRPVVPYTRPESK